MNLERLAMVAIAPTPVIEEGSWGERSLRQHASEMTFYLQDGQYYSIEWWIPSIDRVENIGLTFEDVPEKQENGIIVTKKVLTDYDGVFSLPSEAITLIERCGFVVPDEFKE